MRMKVSVFLSKQAKDLIKRMPSVNEEALIKWFTEERKISIGGGDVIDYLRYLDEVKTND